MKTTQKRRMQMARQAIFVHGNAMVPCYVGGGGGLSPAYTSGHQMAYARDDRGGDIYGSDISGLHSPERVTFHIYKNHGDKDLPGAAEARCPSGDHSTLGPARILTMTSKSVKRRFVVLVGVVAFGSLLTGTYAEASIETQALGFVGYFVPDLQVGWDSSDDPVFGPGYVIDRVDPSGWAARQGLTDPGRYVILEVNGTRVLDVGDVERELVRSRWDLRQVTLFCVDQWNWGTGLVSAAYPAPFAPAGGTRVRNLAQQALNVVDEFQRTFTPSARVVPQGAAFLNDAQAAWLAASSLLSHASTPVLDQWQLREDYQQLADACARMRSRANVVNPVRTGPQIRRIERMNLLCSQIRSELGL
jgi:hypothetical protein